MIYAPCDLEALGEQIAATAASIDAATHHLLAQIREFDRHAGWHRAGALSCAHWLNWRIGLSLGAAREKVRVAHALADLPLIDAALAAGEVSYSKVRAMTRVAGAANEADLLQMARCSTAAQLERICRQYRQVASVTGEQARASEDRRWVSQRATADGMVAITLRVHPDEAARVMEAIRVSAETSGGDGVDGAVAMAEDVLRGGALDRAPVDVSLHVSAETFEGHFDGGDGVSAETCRRLCCDAGIAPVVEDGDGHVLDVGRKTRTIPSAIKRALRARGRQCRFPGCANTRHVDVHHIVHWADGGETSLDNLVELCPRHHRYVHELEFRCARTDDGELAFLDPGGAPIPPTGGVTAASFDRWQQFERAARANTPQWDGAPPDYSRCVEILAHS